MRIGRVEQLIRAAKGCRKSNGHGTSHKKEATQRGKTASPLSLVTVLTTVTENREQEVMLSSPVSLAPLILEQSKCHEHGGPHIGNVTSRFVDR